MAEQLRFAIKRVWNDERHIKALAAVCPDGWKIRRRGRGYRFGERRYHQSLPLDMAAYFTMYCEPPTDWRERRTDWYHIHQAEFRGFRDDGKPVIRITTT